MNNDFFENTDIGYVIDFEFEKNYVRIVLPQLLYAIQGILACIYVSWPNDEITLTIMYSFAIILITIEVIQALILKSEYFKDPFNLLEFCGNLGVFILG